MMTFLTGLVPPASEGADDFYVSPPFGFGGIGLCASIFNKHGASPADRRRDNALQQCQGIRRQGSIVVRTDKRVGSRQSDRKNFPVYTENLIRVDDVMESPKLAE